MAGRDPIFSVGCRPVVRDIDVALPRWDHRPLTVAVLSDTHPVRPWVDRTVLARVVQQVNDLGADLILCPGDFIASPMPVALRMGPEDAIAPLSGLRAPMGVFASLGNHDYADDPLARRTGFAETSVAGTLGRAGLNLLRNEGRLIGDGVWLAGLDSWQAEGRPKRPAHRQDIDAALAGAPKEAPVIVMAHEPDAAPSLAGRADLVVSGHTHGGQVDLWGWRPLTPSVHGGRFSRGLHRLGGTALAVSAGIGYSGVPLRFRCPPEILRLTLRKGDTT